MFKVINEIITLALIISDLLAVKGLWPNEEWPEHKLTLYKIYEVTLHILSIIYIVLTGIGFYENKDDLTIFLSNLDKSFVAYNFVLKIFFFVIKRKQLENLITDIKLSGDKISLDLKKTMTNHVIGISIMSSVIAGAFSLMAQLKGEMITDTWMPFDPHKNKMNLSLTNQIIAILFLIPCLYRAISIQGIVCSIVMYICDQLLELQNRLRDLNITVSNEYLMRQELKMIILKHTRLMRYSNNLKNIFTEFFLIQNLAITFEICLNALTAAMIGLENITLLVTFMAFLANALINAFIFCYLGHELIIQSTGIAQAAYESNWTTWPVKLQKDLLIVIRVAQKPFQLSGAGLVIMCMQTFAQALYNGYSLFALVSDLVD